MLVLVDENSQKEFLRTLPGQWHKVGEGGCWAVWARKA